MDDWDDLTGELIRMFIFVVAAIVTIAFVSRAAAIFVEDLPEPAAYLAGGIATTFICTVYIMFRMKLLTIDR